MNGLHERGRLRALTLVELLVVLAAGGVLLGLGLPALHAARTQSKSEVCLAHLGAMIAMTHEYAALNAGHLPGGLHPAIGHHQTPDSINYNPGRVPLSEIFAAQMLKRSFTWVVGQEIGPRMNDEVVTCPAMAEIVPDAWFIHVSNTTNRLLWPTHYGLNNYGRTYSDAPGLVGVYRATAPQWYFGYPTESTPATYPKYPARTGANLGAINRPAEEWAMADAWYREQTTVFSFLGQQGPYQLGWSGVALPNSPPHGMPGRADTAGPAALPFAKTDGLTNTAFFDGHAASVPSRSAYYQTLELFYGYPGTVNQLPPAGYEHIWNALRWE